MLILEEELTAPLLSIAHLCPMRQGSQFGVGDVEVVTATVDLDEVVSYRGACSSLQEQAACAPRVPAIAVDFDLCHNQSQGVIPDAPAKPRYHDPEEEIALGESCRLSQLVIRFQAAWSSRYSAGCQGLHAGCGTTCGAQAPQASCCPSAAALTALPWQPLWAACVSRWWQP